MRKKQIEKILMEFFNEVYQNTTPSANFELIPKTKKDWFEDYKISESLFEIIREKYINKYKLSKNDLKTFDYYAYLGPSPVFCD